MNISGILVDVFLILVGIGGLIIGFEELNTFRKLIFTRVSSINSFSTGKRISVSGTAVPEGSKARNGYDAGDKISSLEAPFTGRKCLLAYWEVKEFYGHDLTDVSGWSKIESGVEAIAFEIQDRSGSIRVELVGDLSDTTSSFSLSGGQDLVVDHKRDEKPSKRIIEFLENQGIPQPRMDQLNVGGFGGPEEGDRRYYERILQPGDDVFLLATLEESQTTGESGTSTIRLTSEQEFLLADSGWHVMLKKRALGTILSFALAIGLFGYVASRYGLWSIG